MANKKLQVPLSMGFEFLDENGEKWRFSCVWDNGGFSCKLMFPANADMLKGNYDQLTEWKSPGPLDLEHVVNLLRDMNSGGISIEFRNRWLAAMIEKLADRKSEPPRMMSSLSTERRARYYQRKRKK